MSDQPMLESVQQNTLVPLASLYAHSRNYRLHISQGNSPSNGFPSGFNCTNGLKNGKMEGLKSLCQRGARNTRWREHNLVGGYAMDSLSSNTPSNKSTELRICEVCGTQHNWLNSPTCRNCRRKFNKKVCPIDGCNTIIHDRATTCLKHRHLQRNYLYTECQECHRAFPPQKHPACEECRRTVFVLCACQCGKYRRKYNTMGLANGFISGHSVEKREKHRTVHCVNCGVAFDTTSPFRKLCSQDCMTAWMVNNPPHGSKRVYCTCSVCGNDIHKKPSSLRKSKMVVCSKKCQYIAVANQLRGNLSNPKSLVLRRDHAACRICGFDVLVEVHHILPRRKQGPDEEWNLITLCPNHHTMADRGLISQEELYRYVREASPVSN